MILADGNGPAVTSLSQLGPTGTTGVMVATTSPTPYVYSGVLPTQGGINWWIIVGVIVAAIIVIWLLLRR